VASKGHVQFQQPGQFGLEGRILGPALGLLKQLEQEGFVQ
jgi:hypothetical protein